MNSEARGVLDDQLADEYRLANERLDGFALSVVTTRGQLLGALGTGWALSELIERSPYLMTIILGFGLLAIATSWRAEEATTTLQFPVAQRIEDIETHFAGRAALAASYQAPAHLFRAVSGNSGAFSSRQTVLGMGRQHWAAVLSSYPKAFYGSLVVGHFLAAILSWPANHTEGEIASQAQACSSLVIHQLLAPSATQPEEIILNCSTVLPEGVQITRNVVFEGSAASGSIFDCNGAVIDVTAGRDTLERIAIIVRSKQQGHVWDRPQNIVIKNCTIKGFIRVHGLSYTAGSPAMQTSSFTRNHTDFAQDSAPKNILLESMRIISAGNVALYIGPGVTQTKLWSSHVLGTTRSTAIYMDAESAENSISNNVFSIKADRREMIAIDGSARNEITGNLFENPDKGGIFLYRNCGEGGVIRHQNPGGNFILRNTFSYSDATTAKPAVWLGSRGGTQNHCFSDPNHLYGSSASPLDYADNNKVRYNRLVGGTFSLIRDNGRANSIEGNERAAGQILH